MSIHLTNAGLDTDDDWFRQLAVPEEDRTKYTSEPWRPGERRWFRSPNVVCLETWKRRKAPRVDW